MKILNNMISMILFDNITNVKISGQGFRFKKYIRNLTMNLFKTKFRMSEEMMLSILMTIFIEQSTIAQCY